MTSRKTRVCLVNCMHPPDDVRVVEKVGRGLVEAGIEVVWVGPEVALQGGSWGDRHPLDYHFYKPGKGRLGRLALNHRRAFDVAARLPRCDVYIGVEPDSAVAATRLADLFDARAMFDVHEPYDDEMLRPWVPGPLHRPTAWAVRQRLRGVCSQCSAVFGVNDAVLDPIVPSKTARFVVPSCAPLSYADVGAAAVLDPARPTIRAVQGKSTLQHGTRAVLEAMGLAARQVPRLEAVFFESWSQGYSQADFDDDVRRFGCGRHATVLDRVPMRAMPGILVGCDIGLITSIRLWGAKALPNKIFEYMAVGLPIIAPTYGREMCPIIEAERCGILVDTENPHELAKAMVYLCEHPAEAREMGRRGREAFLARYNTTAALKPLVHAIRQP